MSDKQFISIIFKEEQPKYISNTLIDFMKNFLGVNLEYSSNNNIINIIFDYNEEIDFLDIINLITSELYLSCRIYVSGKINDSLVLSEYVSYINRNKKLFDGFSDLIINEDFLVIHNLYGEIIRKNILKQYVNDYQMLDVIKEFLDSNMNISKAANRLFMHRNTVMNKIDKFIDVTGYDIKQFNKAFVIYHLLIND